MAALDDEPFLTRRGSKQPSTNFHLLASAFGTTDIHPLDLRKMLKSIKQTQESHERACEPGSQEEFLRAWISIRKK